MKFHRLLAGTAGTAVAALMAAERCDPIKDDIGIEGHSIGVNGARGDDGI